MSQTLGSLAVGAKIKAVIVEFSKEKQKLIISRKQVLEDDEAVRRAVHVRVDKDRHEGSERNRAAVFDGLELDEREHEGRSHANACKGDTFGIVLTRARRFSCKSDKADDYKKDNRGGNGAPLDEVRRFCADFQQGIKIHKTLLFRRSLSKKKTPDLKNGGCKKPFCRTVRAKSARTENGYLSLAQVLPCRFKWYNLSLCKAPTTDSLNFVIPL